MKCSNLAMKSMKSMKRRTVRSMKPGERSGNKYCRRIDGEVLEHQGSRYAPGSRRNRGYITKDAQIKNLRDQVEAYVQKNSPLEKELDSKRAEVAVLTARVEELTAKIARVQELTAKYVEKTAPLEKELASRRAEVDVLTAAVETLNAKNAELAAANCPIMEYHRGRTYEWKRWMKFVNDGDVVIEIKGIPADPDNGIGDLASLHLVSHPPYTDV